MPIIPGQDPKEAYDVIPMVERPRGTARPMVDRDLQRHSRPALRANPARPGRALRDRSGLSLEPRPYKAARSMMNDCPRCLGSHWVCEAHPERPWEGEYACGCGAPRMPCPLQRK